MSARRKLTNLTESLREVISEETGYRFPFRYKKHRGEGPRGREDHESKEWECGSCGKVNGKTTCMCKNTKTGQEKKIVIQPGYKHRYNKEYKAWLHDNPDHARQSQHRLSPNYKKRKTKE